MTPVIFTFVARVPHHGVDDFLNYERQIIPVVLEHGGRIEQRLRSVDERVEIKIVRFPSRDAYEALVRDYRCLAAQPLLDNSQATVEVFAVTEVADNVTVS
jgi:hypothetical protein